MPPHAYEAVLDAGLLPPLTCISSLRVRRSVGGRVIFELLHRRPERTKADAALVCDMSYYAPGWPAVYTALRGLCYAEFRSAPWSAISTPGLTVAWRRMLSRPGPHTQQAESRTPGVRIPSLRSRRAPTSQELDTWKRPRSTRSGFLREEVTGKALTGITSRSVYERVWALPTFEIHGIKGGFIGDGAKTVIPAQATAKVSLRLVPGQQVEEVGHALERAVAALAPAWAEVKVTLLHGGDPVQVDVSHPAFEILNEAFEAVEGRRAVQVRAGGSIPIVPDLGLSGAPVILTGIGLPDDGLHSPNERLDLRQLWSGIEIFGRFFELFAEKGALRAYSSSSGDTRLTGPE